MRRFDAATSFESVARKKIAATLPRVTAKYQNHDRLYLSRRSAASPTCPALSSPVTRDIQKL